MWFRRRPTSRAALNDARLIQLYVTTGQLKHLGDLYDRYMPLVYGVCLKYLQDEEASKDAVMQIFEKLVVSLRTAEVRQFKSWLYTVTKNHCLMQLRRTNSHHSLTELRTLENLVDETSEVDHWPLIERGMDTLPAEQQRCLQLFYLEQKSYQEVAALTGYELKKVKSYLQNGKRNLKIFVQKHA